MEEVPQLKGPPCALAGLDVHLVEASHLQGGQAAAHHLHRAPRLRADHVPLQREPRAGPRRPDCGGRGLGSAARLPAPRETRNGWVNLLRVHCGIGPLGGGSPQLVHRQLHGTSSTNPGPASSERNGDE